MTSTTAGDSWRSRTHRPYYGLGGTSVAQAGTQASAGGTWSAAVHAVFGVGCLVQARRSPRVAVVSDLQGLRVTGPEPTVLRWDEVREVRAERTRLGTRAVVEAQDGRSVALPEALDVARVRQWQHEAFMAREYPEQG